ncbi:peroxidase [Sarracenia purpurea var. burkii]
MKKGFLDSDQALYNDNEIYGLVENYSQNGWAFSAAFAKSMIRMVSIRIRKTLLHYQVGEVFGVELDRSWVQRPEDGAAATADRTFGLALCCEASLGKPNCVAAGECHKVFDIQALIVEVSDEHGKVHGWFRNVVFGVGPTRRR